MSNPASKVLLAAAAAIFAFGGVMHAAAYAAKTSHSIAASDLPPFLQAELKVLWLADSTTLISLALLCAFLAAKTKYADRTTVLMLALIPGATAVLLYLFLGPFYAAHLLMAAAVLVAVAGLLIPTPGKVPFEHQIPASE